MSQNIRTDSEYVLNNFNAKYDDVNVVYVKTKTFLNYSFANAVLHQNFHSIISFYGLGPLLHICFIIIGNKKMTQTFNNV